MINIRFSGKRYKIYANGKIKCLDKCPEFEMFMLKDIIQTIKGNYGGPSDGFPVSHMAHSLPKYGIEVISYRDYEMKNAKSDTIY